MVAAIGVGLLALQRSRGQGRVGVGRKRCVFFRIIQDLKPGWFKMVDVEVRYMVLGGFVLIIDPAFEGHALGVRANKLGHILKSDIVIWGKGDRNGRLIIGVCKNSLRRGCA